MKNIGVMLKQRAVVSPLLEAYVEPSSAVRVNYQQMNARVNQCVSVLRALDVCKGDRVALLMPNSLEFCCLFYATAKIGAVAVPLNTRLTAAELEFILSDSGSSILVYGDGFAETVAGIRAGTSHPCTVREWIPATEGKTSLLEILCGLRQPDSGQIILDDRDVTHLDVMEIWDCSRVVGP